jgi:hypothetical protein
MNVFIVEDDNWDNYAIISKYISTNYLPENVRIQHVYNKHLQSVSNICTVNNFDIYRRNIDDKEPKKSYYEIIKNMNICIIFHNFVEYTTTPSFIMKVCEENKIPYIIISEHIKRCFLNGEIYDGKFKGALKMAITPGGNNCQKFKVIDDEMEMYNNLNNEVNRERKSLDEIKKIINNSYEKIQTYRNKKSIVLIDILN